MSMNAPASPTVRAIGVAREWLRTLSSARQVMALYPSGHPNRRESVEQLLVGLRALDRAVAGTATLFVTRHSLYLGPTLLARESLSLFRLVEAFEAAGIETVELTPETTHEDLDAFVEVLGGAPLSTDRFGGIILNRIRPAVAVAEGPHAELSDLRRAYAMSLEVLRETAVRAAAGEPIDLDAATAVVEDLAGRVLADPSHALLLTTVKSYDEYTYYHMVNVCLLTIAMAQAIGLRPDQVTTLGLGGLLHDVGKVQMPADVLQHVGRLSPEQWRLVQRHPVDGAGLVFSTSEGLYHPAATVVLEHHAAFDLSGYPGLSARARPSMPARLVAVADCFDAVTSKRSYRAAADRAEALAIIESGAGHGFDPRIVRVFLTLLGAFPVGSVVELSTGEVAIVTRSDPTRMGHPEVALVLDADGNAADLEPLDLTEVTRAGEPRASVERTVDPTALGIDVMEVLTTGELRIGDPPPPTGLVHEPSPGEPRPEGYVDTHRHHHPAPPEGFAADPDISPPIDGG